MFDDLSFKIIEYAGRGLCCSQILISLILDSEGGNNPDLVRTMGGLCYGVGNKGDLCGVYTSGVCLLALKSHNKANPLLQGDRFNLMAEAYGQWFHSKIKDTYGGVTCVDLMGVDRKGQPDLAKCSSILTESYIKLLEILEQQEQ